MAPVRLLIIALVGLTLVQSAKAQTEVQEAQGLVDRATLALQEMLTQGDTAALEDARRLLARARGALVCPRIFRAGFIFGGQGGSCVLVGRTQSGDWSYPVFYGLGSGSVGFQIGVQDMQVLMMILTDRGLAAIMDSQFQFGADASIAVATIGAGIQGATTAAAGADIVAVAKSRGLFAGVALEGSILSARSEWNRAYYNRDLAARQVVLAGQGRNGGADQLRATLARYGTARSLTSRRDEERRERSLRDRDRDVERRN